MLPAFQNLIQKVPNPAGRSGGGLAGASSQQINSPMMSDLDRSTASQARERGGEAGWIPEKSVPTRGAQFKFCRLFPLLFWAVELLDCFMK